MGNYTCKTQLIPTKMWKFELCNGMSKLDESVLCKGYGYTARVRNNTVVSLLVNIVMHI
jgi:hypothetical protein